MKITISLSNENFEYTRGFETFQELLNHLGVGDWEVHGQPMLEYMTEVSVYIVKGSNEQTLTVRRDVHGTYQALIDKRDLSYYVMSKFNEVLQVCKSPDSISAKILSCIRYSDSKFDEDYEDSSHQPCKIYVMYKDKYKKGQKIDSRKVFTYLDWYNCKQSTKSRRGD
jgi:hypothetical protein